MTKTIFMSAVAIVIFMTGCAPIFSPMTGKMVNFDQLIEEWVKFQKDARDKQDCYTKEIAKTDDITQAAKNDIQSSPLSFFLQFLDDPSNSGVGVTLATAALAALTGGLHLNNLRLNRKIALPEIDDTDDNARGDPADKPASAAKPTNMSDLAILGAFGAVGK